MLNHEIQAYAARVAFAAKCKRADFSDVEMLMIEDAYYNMEHPGDCAYTIQTMRVYDAGIVEDAE